MKFKFTIQPYQAEAVDSVVGVFADQPFNDHFSYRRDVTVKRDVTNWYLSDDEIEQISMGFANNRLTLVSSQLLTNVNRIQGRNNIGLAQSVVSSGPEACSLNVEMETGTGKGCILPWSKVRGGDTAGHIHRPGSVGYACGQP